MSDNPAFVLRGIEDAVYEQRPIPESTLECDPHATKYFTETTVSDKEVLVEVKKTG
jgi:D-xylulose reductase